MIKRALGYEPGTSVQLVWEKSGSLIAANKTRALGLTKLDAYLAEKQPVMVGVDWVKGTTYNHDHTTDHFVVIVGSGIERGRKYYRFFDVGTAHPDKGTNSKNRLYYDLATGFYSGKSYATGHFYTLTQVRFK